MTGNHVPCQDILKDKSKVFTEDDIKRITSNYSVLIGKGGFGEVYKGTLDDGDDLVAVKRYINRDLIEEFIKEVSIHSQMRHKNVVQLIGYCIGTNNLILVTEYISKGSLYDVLLNSDISLPLDIRLGIAIGCADALSYMHSIDLSSGVVCHTDIKPANILLDDNLTAKVSDFGTSRFLSGGITQYTMTIKGSLNYMDPICFQDGRVTPKNDVYSFGVVLLELLARRKAKDGQISLIGTFREASENGRWQRVPFDAEIANDRNMKILKDMGKLATECLDFDIRRRPQMNDIAKRLCMLKKVLRNINYPESILASHHSWRKSYKEDISMANKSLSFLKRNSSNSKILSKLNNVRVFTNEGLNEVTRKYSCVLGRGTSAKVYKGTLEDNTVVAVRRYFDLFEGFKEAFINGGLIQSQIVHKNIIKVLGYCLDADTPAIIYEYAGKGCLSDVLDSHEQFPLDLRVKIAVNTAEALEFLHSPAAGVIRHGYVVSSKILLDNNFVPKLTGFTWARKFILENKITAGDSVISSSLPETSKDPIPNQFDLLRIKIDVYQFGVLLLVLMSRKNFISYSDHYDLAAQFNAAHEADNSGRAFFDRDITADEDICVLEEIGRVAMKCIDSEPDERPTMKEVAEQLRMIRRSWKSRTPRELHWYLGASDAETTTSDRLLSSDI